MALVFAYRTDDANIDARSSTNGKRGTLVNIGGAVRSADAGAIGGFSLDFSSTTATRSVTFPGKNWANGRPFSLLIRWKPNYTGTPAGNRGLWGLESGYGTAGGQAINIYHAATTGNIIAFVRSETANIINSVSIKNAWSPTSGTWYDLVITWDGTNAANAFKFYIDAALETSTTATGSWSASTNNEYFKSITIGGNSTTIINAGYLNECVVWDTVIDPTVNQNLESGAGLLNGASRTSFVSDVAGATLTSFDGLNSTDPGVGNVKTGTSYFINGTSYSGTYTATSGSQINAVGLGNVKILGG